MKLIIRNILPEEIYEYSSCNISSWRSGYKGIIPDDFLDNLSVEEKAEKTRKYMNESEGNPYYCAVYDNKIIGNLVIIKSRDEDKTNTGEIVAFYLLEEFWGKGYGREMMDFAIEKLTNAGYDEIILWVLEENKRARRFYEKCGFVFDGTKKEIIIGKPLIEVRYTLKFQSCQSGGIETI